MKILTLRYAVGDRVKVITANGDKLASVLKIEKDRVKVSIPLGGIRLIEWINI